MELIAGLDSIAENGTAQDSCLTAKCSCNNFENNLNVAPAVFGHSEVVRCTSLVNLN